MEIEAAKDSDLKVIFQGQETIPTELQVDSEEEPQTSIPTEGSSIKEISVSSSKVLLLSNHLCSSKTRLPLFLSNNQ